MKCTNRCRTQASPKCQFPCYWSCKFKNLWPRRQFDWGLSPSQPFCQDGMSSQASPQGDIPSCGGPFFLPQQHASSGPLGTNSLAEIGPHRLKLVGSGSKSANMLRESAEIGPTVSRCSTRFGNTLAKLRQPGARIQPKLEETPAEIGAAHNPATPEHNNTCCRPARTCQYTICRAPSPPEDNTCLMPALCMGLVPSQTLTNEAFWKRLCGGQAQHKSRLI